MKMKTLIRHTLLGLCLLSFQLLASAQVVAESVEAKSPPQLLEKAPTFGTFYLLGRIPSPPYPFDPYFGALPVYIYDGVFFVDDSQVSFMEPSFSFEGGTGGGLMLMARPVRAIRARPMATGWWEPTIPARPPTVMTRRMCGCKLTA